MAIIFEKIALSLIAVKLIFLIFVAVLQIKR